MYNFLVSLLITVIGCGLWGIIFLVTEIRCAQRGYDTWDWIKRLYANTPWLQKVRW